MVAAVPFTAQNSTPADAPPHPLSPSPSPASHKPWSPNADDHLIFKWVKMDGKSQEEVAHMFGISQPTVSRVVQRYERWQAHAKEREDGRLDHTERLRAQRWLTYERNELILANCLRIAGEMERFTDISKSTTRRTFSNPAQESEVRTEHSLLDRSGIAARFLRLAFRINMEQLKLVQLDELPPAQPLTDDEIEEQFRDAAAAAEELAAARRRSHERAAEIMAEHNAAKQQPPARASGDARSHAPRGDASADAPRPPQDGSVDSAHGGFDVDEEHISIPGHPPCGSAPVPPHEPSTSLAEQADQLDQAPPTLNLESETLNSVPPPTHHSPCPVNTVNNLNKAGVQEIDATHAEPCLCIVQASAEKCSSTACITDHDILDSPPYESPDSTNLSALAAAASPTH